MVAGDRGGWRGGFGIRDRGAGVNRCRARPWVVCRARRSGRVRPRDACGGGARGQRLRFPRRRRIIVPAGRPVPVPDRHGLLPALRGARRASGAVGPARRRRVRACAGGNPARLSTAACQRDDDDTQPSLTPARPDRKARACVPGATVWSGSPARRLQRRRSAWQSLRAPRKPGGCLCPLAVLCAFRPGTGPCPRLVAASAPAARLVPHGGVRVAPARMGIRRGGASSRTNATNGPHPRLTPARQDHAAPPTGDFGWGRARPRTPETDARAGRRPVPPSHRPGRQVRRPHRRRAVARIGQ
jgi:hypothetical protein